MIIDRTREELPLGCHDDSYIYETTVLDGVYVTSATFVFGLMLSLWFGYRL